MDATRTVAGPIEVKTPEARGGEPVRLRVKPGFAWDGVLAKVKTLTPEVFSDDPGVAAILNCIDGRWGTPGNGRPILSPIDGSTLGKLPMIDLATAQHAVRTAAKEARAWSKVDLDARRAKVAKAVADMKANRDLLAALLVWEIGKPLALAQADADRCIEGVEWYLANCEAMLAGRHPLGLVSNIASWNYPLSVLMHMLLVQALAGNSAIAKTPTDGGGICVAACVALARRNGLPISLVSGSGGALSDALVRHDAVDCLAFVGGRSNGRDIATSLVDTSKRYMLEMEGVNAYGVWEFSDWAGLAKQIKKGFEYAKQRCTAYPRFVVQRRLLPDFLDAYLAVHKSLRFGNPVLVARDDDPLPSLDFGPVINAKKVEELRAMWSEACAGGALPIASAAPDPAMFLAGQDISAYIAPAAVLSPPRSCQLYHSEPFGPIDSIVVIDRFEELIAEMNVSNGNLVSSLATDDPELASRVRQELRCFKFGHNKLRSRGDKDELFGGLGQSWKGCFVGGGLLVRAVTKGRHDDDLPGNFHDGTRLPAGVV
jgi:acyl-CoA reductase-like NAD-dependent aldehyde dehydrogenase